MYAPYRTKCTKCASKQKRINKLVRSIENHKLRNYQRFEIARCPFCDFRLYGNKTKSSEKDDLFCSGRWKINCPNVPHMHRYCAVCKASWLEKTLEQTKIINVS